MSSDTSKANRASADARRRRTEVFINDYPLMRDERYSHRAIGLKYGLTVQSTRNKANNLGIAVKEDLASDYAYFAENNIGIEEASRRYALPVEEMSGRIRQLGLDPLADDDRSDDFVEDYIFLRDVGGLSNAGIAARLEMSELYVARRARELGLYKTTAYEKRAQAVLDRLVKSGEVFTAEHLPCLFDQSLAKTLLTRAVIEKRVAVAGRRASRLEHRTILMTTYVGVAA